MVSAFDEQAVTGDAVHPAFDEYNSVLFCLCLRLEFIDSTGWRVFQIVGMGFAEKAYGHAIGVGPGNFVIMTCETVVTVSPGVGIVAVVLNGFGPEQPVAAHDNKKDRNNG